MDGPNASPKVFSHHRVAAATLVQQWRRNGGRSDNASGNGDEASVELVVPAAASLDQQQKVEMAVPGAAVRILQPSTPLELLENWIPPFNPQRYDDRGPSSSSDSLTDADATIEYPEVDLLRQLQMAWSGVMERDKRAMSRPESTLLLRLLEGSNAERTEEVLHVVYARDVHCTMADELGSRVFVALLNACNGRQMEELVRTATCNGVQLTKVAGQTKFGSNCIKKLIEKVKNSPGLSRRVANALAEGACHLTTEEHGRDVLKHCFTHLRHNETDALVKAAAEGLMEYATDASGCGCLKYCITQARGPLRWLMMATVATNALKLATHCYGNYVVQHVLDVEGSEDVKELIFLTMAVNFVDMAMNKCGSFVLEKLLNSPQYGLYLCRVVASYSLSWPERFEQVTRDRHGNYVIRRTLEVSSAAPDIHRLLVRAIAGLPRSLMTDPYANKLYKTALRGLQLLR